MIITGLQTKKNILLLAQKKLISRDLRSLNPNLTLILFTPSRQVIFFLCIISIFDQNFDLLDGISNQVFCINKKCPIDLF